MKALLINIGKLKPSYRYGGLFLVLLLIIFVYYLTVYIPYLDQAEYLFREFNSKKAEFSKMVVLAGARGQLLEEVEGLNRSLKVAINMLPDKKEIPSLLKKLSDEAEKFGLEVYYFEPLPEIKKAFYAEVPVSIRLKGSFNEVLSFFDSVNKLARIVNIGNISMQVSMQTRNRSYNSKKKGKKDRLVRAFSDFRSNKIVLDVVFGATTYRFLTESEMGDANAKK